MNRKDAEPLRFIYSQSTEFGRTDFYGPLPDGRCVSFTEHRSPDLPDQVALESVETCKRALELKGMTL